MPYFLDLGKFCAGRIPVTEKIIKKGKKFEKYSRDIIFPQEKFNLLKQTHNYAQNSKDYVKESLEPDFAFECKETKQLFYVEAKFRSEIHDGKIQFSYKTQFERYKEIEKTATVFIIIGIGNDPSKPEHVCLIPLNDIDNIFLTESFLEKYTIANNRPIAISKLQELIKIRNKKQPKAQASTTPVIRAVAVKKRQTRFYDHIIRDDESFINIRQYITNNASNWCDDTLNEK